MATFFSAQVGQKILPGDPTGQVEVEINVRAIPLSLDDGSSGLNVIM